MTIIAIDPGLRGSGVAIYKENMFVSLKKLQMWHLYELIDENKDCFFLVEDSNLSKSNWHGASGRANVGKNKAVSTLIIEYMKDRGIKYKALKPDGYSQRYADKKGNYSNLSQKIFESETGWKGSSNKDSRAASAMIVVWKDLIL